MNDKIFETMPFNLFENLGDLPCDLKGLMEFRMRKKDREEFVQEHMMTIDGRDLGPDWKYPPKRSRRRSAPSQTPLSKVES
jgi:hypothetical protein